MFKHKTPDRIFYDFIFVMHVGVLIINKSINDIKALVEVISK